MKLPEFLRGIRAEERGLTGVETAIVLIAFVVAAAVFSYTVLSAGVFSAEKSNRSIYSGLNQVQSSIALNGSVLAIDSDSDNNVDQIAFTVVSALSGEPVDLTEPTDSETVIDTLEFDIAKGKVPHIINVSGDIYAIAYQGDDDNGFLKTVEITSGGAITDTVVDTLEFDTAKGKVPHIINVSGDIYAIAYQGDDDNGFLKTVEITSGGAITDTVVDTLEFDTVKGKVPHIINVSGDIYAIAYQGDGDDGYLKTVEIASGGAITDTVVDTLEFDTAKGKVPHIINVSGDIYAIAYQGDGDDGYLKTVEIASNGTITDTVVDTLEFDTVKGKVPHIINVSGDIYAIAYQGDDDNGFLKTVEIASSGAITDTVVDTLEFDTVKGKVPHIINVSGDIYAIAYQGDEDGGFIKTVEINSGGAITDTVISTLEFDTVKGKEPCMVSISGSTHAIAYQGDGDDGFVITVYIKSSGIIGGNGLADNGSGNLLVISYFDKSNELTDLAWTRTMVGRDDGDILMERFEHAKITVDLTATGGAIGNNYTFILEIKPESGPVLVIQRTTPPVIDDVTILR